MKMPEMIWQVLMKFCGVQFCTWKGYHYGNGYHCFAIATAMTSSGIGIVRISGDEAVSVTDRIF